MKVALFTFSLILFMCLYCGPVLGSSFAKEDASTSLPDMNHSQKQHTMARGKLLSSLSDEERKWYQKFQDGLMFFSGWKDISADIIQALPPDERPLTEELLEHMGVRIGTEWSKDNAIRRIDTDQLRNWGDRLRKARKKGDVFLSQTVRAISAEVDELLRHPHSGQINNS